MDALGLRKQGVNGMEGRNTMMAVDVIGFDSVLDLWHAGGFPCTIFPLTLICLHAQASETRLATSDWRSHVFLTLSDAWLY